MDANRPFGYLVGAFESFRLLSNNITKLKIIVLNLIIRTKLMYRLESAQINDSLEKYINTFHIKALGKILG